MSDAEKQAMEEAPEQTAALEETANERFKRSFSSWFGGSICAATVLHFGAFAFWPQLEAEDVRIDSGEIETVNIPPPIDIPPPPPALARPATPVISDVSVDQDITIELTTFDANPVEDLPPPPEEVELDIRDQPGAWVVNTVQAAWTNRQEMSAVLSRNYPAMLRDAGIGGTTLLWIFVEKDASASRVVVQSSSGHKALDDAAVKVAREFFRFTTGMNREDPVAMWVSIPIVWTPT